MKLSLIIPTYNEKENIKKLLPQLKKEFDLHQIDAEIIFVDDNSPDGTGQVLDELKEEGQNIKVIHRAGKSGLSSAVLEGFRGASGEVLAVIDADLSHPVEMIAEMYRKIVAGASMVIGSRYVPGGRIEGWGIYRKLLSKGATFFARIFVDVKDPMSGFFMFRREIIRGKEINPKGFKILLDILVKSDFKNIAEIPITFINRTEGVSKAGIGEVIFFLQNLLGYLPYKREVAKQFFKFAFVGFVGTIMNIAILYTLTEYFGIYYIISALFAFIVSATSNFMLNKVWTFRENVSYKIIKKYVSFFIVSISALSFNILFLYIFTEYFRIYYILSQILAIGISLSINFIGNKIWTFRK